LQTFLYAVSHIHRFASQHIWCISQARINWEFVPGRAPGIKMVVMAEVGAPIRMGWQSIRIVDASACVHFAQENPEDGKQRYDIWVLSRGCPHMPTQTGGGETHPEHSTTLC